jgi:hypothetical protein
MVKQLEKLAEIGQASAEGLSSLHKNVVIMQHGVQASTLGQVHKLRLLNWHWPRGGLLDVVLITQFQYFILAFCKVVRF